MPDNWACPCCGFDAVRAKDKMQVRMLRLSIPEVFVINGTRCEKHNTAVGGAPGSAHLAKWGFDRQVYSLALDLGLTIWTLEAQKQLFVACENLDPTGLGWYDDGHVHVDWKPGRLQRWSRLDGVYHYWLK